MTEAIRGQRASAASATESITFADENVRPAPARTTRSNGTHRASDQFVSDTASLPTRARVVLSRLGQTQVSYTGMDAETARARLARVADHALGVALPPDPRTQLGPAPERLHDLIERQHEHAFRAGFSATLGAAAGLGAASGLTVATRAGAHAVEVAAATATEVAVARPAAEYAIDAASAVVAEVVAGASEGHGPSVGEVVTRVGTVGLEAFVGAGATGGVLLVETTAHSLRDHAERVNVAAAESDWQARRDAAQTAVRSGREQADAEFQLFARGERNGVDLDRMTRDFGYGQRMQVLMRTATRR